MSAAKAHMVSHIIIPRLLRGYTTPTLNRCVKLTTFLCFSRVSFAIPDDSEIISMSTKLAHEPMLQEEIVTETCVHQEHFGQPLGGLLDVPPPSAFLSNSCCPPKPQPAGELQSIVISLSTLFCVFSNV